MEENLFLFIGVFFAVFGVIFSVIGFIVHKKYIRKTVICTCQTTAKVIDIVTRYSNYRDNDGFEKEYVTYSPELEYYANGVWYKNVDPISSAPCRYKVGEEVLLNFDGNNPDIFYLPNDNSHKMLYSIFIGLGLLFVVIGVTMSICNFIDFSRVFGRF